jgi:lambda family phage minor tail protein L
VGTSYFNENDQSVATLAADVCGKRLSSCKARFGTTAELPFGSYPGVGTFFT